MEDSTPDHAHIGGSEIQPADVQNDGRSLNRYYRSLFFHGTSFFLIFSAFLSLQSLQSSLNEVLGFVALSVLYVSFMLSCLISPFLNKVFGPKRIIVLSYVGHCVYIVTNFYPSYYTLVPGSVVLGAASGPLWTSSSCYITALATNVAILKGKEASIYISRFFGVFFLFLFLSAVFGNLVSSAVLLPATGGLHRAVLNETVANLTDETCALNAKSETPIWSFYLLMSLFFLMDVIAVFIGIFGLVRLEETAYRERSIKMIKKEFKSNFVNLYKIIISWKHVLLCCIIFYQGYHQGFISGVFNKYYVSECVGVGYVGFVQTVWGICSGVTSLFVGRLINYFPRTFIIIFLYFGDIAVIVFMILWPREPSFIMVFLTAAYFGVTDASINTVVTSLIGIITDKPKQDVAFCLQRMSNAFGFVASFLVSTFLPVSVNLWICLGILLPSVPLYCVSDMMANGQTKDFFRKVVCKICLKQHVAKEAIENLKKGTN